MKSRESSKKSQTINAREMTDQETAVDAERPPDKFDWLTYAIFRVGKHGKPGIRGIDIIHVAAAELGISWQKVIAIRKHGAGILTFTQAIDLAKRAEISIELLRVGPLPTDQHPRTRSAVARAA
jgi:hypothetical protein